MSLYPKELAAHLTALLFVSEEPLAIDTAARVLEVERSAVEAAASYLQQQPPPGLLVQRSNGHLALSSCPRSTPYVERFLGSPEATRLSRAALEVLALVAYWQPVTRAEIESVRGVNSDSAVATLLARGLLVEVGRRETVGHPTLLGTSDDFLRYLGIGSLEELPPLHGFAAALDDRNGHHPGEDAHEEPVFSLSR